jgi:hypothetical protein
MIPFPARPVQNAHTISGLMTTKTELDDLPFQFNYLCPPTHTQTHTQNSAHYFFAVCASALTLTFDLN